MKTLPRRFFTLACAAALGVLSMVASSHADTFLMLNFSAGNVVTNVPTQNRTISGFTNVTATQLANTPLAGVNNIAGTGVNFSFTNVGAFDTGNNAEPLTTSGFYNFGNNTATHTFTLSGLPAGSAVTLFAVAAWDGNNRGGFLTFGGESAQAQTIGDPGTAPTLANFTQINVFPFVVGANGIATGALDGAGGLGSATEGQVGSMIFQVSPTISVPEPSSIVMMVLGGAGALGFALRRARA